jgi:phosphatidylethanolamine-binding protein (PEBP) family uncharacterized protein
MPGQSTGAGAEAGGAPAQSNAPEHPPLVTIDVGIPVLSHRGAMPRRYTCDGRDLSPPISWSDIPRDTAELDVFIVNIRPTGGRLSFDWAVAGLSPRSHGIPAGRLPPAAVVGRNNFGRIGYSICPPPAASEQNYIVRVIALPHALAARPGFDAEALYLQAERVAKVVGVTGADYTRQ